MTLRTTMLAGVLALFATRAAHADKNYLIFIIDDLGASKVNIYKTDFPGYTPQYLPRTPTIDTLALRGLRFTKAWATPECSPTRASFLTGQYPSWTGIGKALPNPGPNVPDSALAGMNWTGIPSIASEFQSRGYTTALFGKWHVGRRDVNGSVATPPATFTAQPNPSLAGFDRFWGSYDGDLGSYTSWTRIDWQKSGSGTVITETTHATQKTEQTALSWINSRTQPWLAVVAFNAPHSANTAGSSWTYADVTGTHHSSTSLDCLDTQDCAAADVPYKVYQGLVEDVDYKMQTLLAGMDQTTLGNTVVVVIGDNGTPSAVEESVFANSNFPESRGKGTTYMNGVRVPFVVADGYAYNHMSPAHGPTITTPGLVIDARVNTLDIFNTLLGDAFWINRAGITSSPFNDCFTANDHWCNWSTRYAYTEMFDSNTSSEKGQATVAYGNDVMVTWYDNRTAYKCMQHEFYDESTDPLQMTPLTWTGTRATRLEDRFNSIHTGVVDWANPTGSSVVSFCP